jgi:2,4-dienoyl-CoA reductase-like NADH-dependent reductase (Old Yellow Enzyme family)
MGDEDGYVGAPYVELHAALARGGVGLSFTGHLFCHPRGRYGVHQPGIHRDEAIPGLRRATDAVHREGGRIFAQIAHAGSQSMVPGNRPLAPSPVPNVMTGRPVEAASAAEVDEAVEAFAAAARRAVEAGFDGVHIHGANGYLISQFRSPLTNRRDDAWGEDREAFPLAVVRAVREALPRELGLTMKLGFRDLVDGPDGLGVDEAADSSGGLGVDEAADGSGGLGVDEAVRGAKRLVEAGLDGIEVSSNLMSDYVSASIRPYIAVDRRRAAEDLLLHRLHKDGEPEAYFLPFARALRREVDTAVILVGGLRRVSTMAGIVAAGDADFLSLARPLIRQPDLVRVLESGGASAAECVSCNICLMHDEHHPLRCWRTPRRRLAEHALYRVLGGFRKTGSGKKPSAETA